MCKKKFFGKGGEKEKYIYKKYIIYCNIYKNTKVYIIYNIQYKNTKIYIYIYL